jgi:hypothetical protein
MLGRGLCFDVGCGNHEVRQDHMFRFRPGDLFRIGEAATPFPALVSGTAPTGSLLARKWLGEIFGDA